MSYVNTHLDENFGDFKAECTLIKGCLLRKCILGENSENIDNTPIFDKSQSKKSRGEVDVGCVQVLKQFIPVGNIIINNGIHHLEGRFGLQMFLPSVLPRPTLRGSRGPRCGRPGRWAGLPGRLESAFCLTGRPARQRCPPYPSSGPAPRPAASPPRRAPTRRPAWAS